VVLSPTVTDIPSAVTALARENGIWPEFVYQSALSGFSAVMSEAQALALAKHPLVEWVEEDGVMEASTTQTGATWGLDRIDQRDLPLNSTYVYDFDGSGVNAYIIDTGIRASHQQFSGRVGNGYTAISDGNGTNDCNGHGTHVSGTVGGTTCGVSKGVTLHMTTPLPKSSSENAAVQIEGILDRIVDLRQLPSAWGQVSRFRSANNKVENGDLTPASFIRGPCSSIARRRSGRRFRSPPLEGSRRVARIPPASESERPDAGAD
jgi:subtilisin family serine protease